MPFIPYYKKIVTSPHNYYPVPVNKVDLDLKKYLTRTHYENFNYDNYHTEESFDYKMNNLQVQDIVNLPDQVSNDNAIISKEEINRDYVLLGKIYNKKFEKKSTILSFDLNKTEIDYPGRLKIDHLNNFYLLKSSSSISVPMVTYTGNDLEKSNVTNKLFFNKDYTNKFIIYHTFTIINNTSRFASITFPFDVAILDYELFIKKNYGVRSIQDSFRSSSLSFMKRFSELTNIEKQESEINDLPYDFRFYLVVNAQFKPCIINPLNRIQWQKESDINYNEEVVYNYNKRNEANWNINKGLVQEPFYVAANLIYTTLNYYKIHNRQYNTNIYSYPFNNQYAFQAQEGPDFKAPDPFYYFKPTRNTSVIEKNTPISFGLGKYANSWVDLIDFNNKILELYDCYIKVKFIRII